MEKEEIKKLFRKYLEGKCTDAEQAILEAWYLEYNEGAADLSPEQVREIGENMYRELPGNDGRSLPIRYLLAAAAIGVIMVSLILQIMFHKTDLIVKNHPVDIAPGGNQALLTLANGKKIDLMKARPGELVAQPGISLFKNAAGEIIYLYANKDPDKTHPSGNNNITTPNGGVWEVTLPDGSKVWLNNATSLTYPVSFRSQPERKISLSGEAYFEVAKDQCHPFVVVGGDQEVHVLGTHFNIRAFPNDMQIRTTLFEGQILVNTLDKRFRRKLTPGKQSLLTGNGISVSAANIEEAIAWKNGYFRFQNTPIELVMQDLARWYGIDVQYDGPVSTEKLNGRISRSQNISKVLSALEATKTVHFKVKGRRVIVMN